MSISVDRIAEQAKQIALKREEDERRWQVHEIPDPSDPKLKEFRDRLPGLTSQARQQHNLRFKSLKEILEDFREPLVLIRDRFFPEGSKIFYLERYERLWEKGSGDNDYSAALMFYETADLRELITVAVVGRDKLVPTVRVRGKLPQYISIDITEYDLWTTGRNVDLPPYDSHTVEEDFQDITDSNLLFQPDFMFSDLRSTQGRVCSEAEQFYWTAIPYRENGSILNADAYQAAEHSLAEILSHHLNLLNLP